jgi:methylated-DNA-[protein]-cysteine S-methyltransferase
MTRTDAERTTTLPTPLGPLILVATERALVAVEFAERALVAGVPSGRTPLLDEACAQLRAYFAGERREFDLPLAPEGTAFQRAVWTALRAIPCGETRTYGDVARQVGRPAAVRAVGAANGRNPIAIVVPCHRVIGADGSLTGYGGGLDRKRWLLAHERGELALGLTVPPSPAIG